MFKQIGGRASPGTVTHWPQGFRNQPGSNIQSGQPGTRRKEKGTKIKEAGTQNKENEKPWAGGARVAITQDCSLQPGWPNLTRKQPGRPRWAERPGPQRPNPTKKQMRRCPSVGLTMHQNPCHAGPPPHHRQHSRKSDARDRDRRCSSAPQHNGTCPRWDLVFGSLSTRHLYRVHAMHPHGLHHGVRTARPMLCRL